MAQRNRRQFTVSPQSQYVQHPSIMTSLFFFLKLSIIRILPKAIVHQKALLLTPDILPWKFNHLTLSKSLQNELTSNLSFLESSNTYYIHLHPMGKQCVIKQKSYHLTLPPKLQKGLMNLMFQYPVPSPAIPICRYGMQLELHSS